jgi:hypothetical protein
MSLDLTFYQNLKNFHEYLMQHSLKSGNTKEHFRQVKVPGNCPLLKGLENVDLSRL